MVHTVRGGGLVRSTIGWIETRIPAKNNWIDLYGEDPAAVFVCKVGYFGAFHRGSAGRHSAVCQASSCTCYGYLLGGLHPRLLGDIG